MLRNLALVVLSLAFCAAHNAVAADNVYKWLDKNGKVHFGDRPPPDASASEALDIKSRRARQRRLLDSFEHDRAEKKHARAEDKERRKAQALKCLHAKDDLDQMRQASYLYDLNAAGEKIIQSAAERQQATLRLEKLIKKNCK
jgi:hypothetical protein